MKRAAPILPVRDLSVSLAFYERLGFATREYHGGGYGFAKRDRAEIHLGVVPGNRPSGAGHSAYLWVDDADALAREWRTAGLDVNMPEDTEWGQHEGAVVDPDGNVLRFGSPLPRSTTDQSERRGSASEAKAARAKPPVPLQAP
jgi:catechol 2,3-dioxygenase-like lactoylglutathione lyase family enzyme